MRLVAVFADASLTVWSPLQQIAIGYNYDVTEGLEDRMCPALSWDERFFGVADAARHIQYAAQFDVPPVWDALLPGADGAPVTPASLAAGGEHRVTTSAEGGLSMTISGSAAGAAGKSLGDVMASMLEMLNKQRSADKLAKAGVLESAVVDGGGGGGGGGNDNKNDDCSDSGNGGGGPGTRATYGSPISEETTLAGSRETIPSPPAKKACWVEDSDRHTCKVDSDCGVDGATCTQRVCSPHGFCGDELSLTASAADPDGDI